MRDLRILDLDFLSWHMSGFDVYHRPSAPTSHTPVRGRGSTTKLEPAFPNKLIGRPASNLLGRIVGLLADAVELLGRPWAIPWALSWPSWRVGRQRQGWRETRRTSVSGRRPTSGGVRSTSAPGAACCRGHRKVWSMLEEKRRQPRLDGCL